MRAMAESPLGLEVCGLGVSAGSRWLVRDVTFDARPGELVAVIGPNGAGKTTLLEAIAGLRPSQAGALRIRNRELVRFAEFARTFSFLPDACALPAEASVQTLIDHASARASGNVATRPLLEGLSVEPLLSKPVGILSRGEHQRVALYCTLALGRPVALLDEPFSVFDPLQLQRVLATVRGVMGSTSIIASIHQLADAERIADRVLLLANGKMVAFGDLTDLRDRVGNAAGSLETVFVSLLEETVRAS